jgi:hypothetical protein
MLTTEALVSEIKEKKDMPEMPGGKGTYASTGNYIPLIGAAAPGMRTVVDMPIPRFWAPRGVGA